MDEEHVEENKSLSMHDACKDDPFLFFVRENLLQFCSSRIKMILVISVREIVIGDHFDFIRDVICICLPMPSR